MSTLSRGPVSLSPIVLLAGVAAFLVFIYWESVADMFGLWRLSSHQHGLLVFPISIIVMAVASATEMRYLGGADHIYFGWVLFGVVMLSIMWVGASYADLAEDEGSKSAPSNLIGGNLAGFPLIIVLGLAMLATTLNPLQSEALSIGKLLFGLAVLAAAVVLAGRHIHTIGDERRKRREPVATRDLQSIGLVAIVAVVLVFGPQSVAVVEKSATALAAVPNIDKLRNCNSPKSWANNWFPRMRDADIEKAATLDCINSEVSVYVAGYAGALQGKELVSGSNRLTPNDWRRYTTRSPYEFSTQDGASRRVIELTVNAPDYRGLVWYWYEIDTHDATGDIAVKALQVWAMLRGRPAGGHVVLLATQIETNKEDARQLLEAVSIDLISAELQATSGDRT